ncbi:MAG: YbjN domain-containing protein [Bacteroidales bacterium]|nr:YbjN domain-containing protein [Bacteroidales bacterium]
MSSFNKVKEYLLELEYNVLSEDLKEELLVVNKEDSGISNLIIDCEEPILIIEYPLFKIKKGNEALYIELLQKNREIIHGAFALADDNTLIFRDTLQLENLDLNELDGSLESLELLLAEYGNRIIEISKMQ